MGFYDLSKSERTRLVNTINREIYEAVSRTRLIGIHPYFSDEDTYIRKTAYLSIGKLYKNTPELRTKILKILNQSLKSNNPKVRQTTINAAGEIGMGNFEVVRHFLEVGLFDNHHSVRNAVIGSVKKMGAKNPIPTLKWAKKYLGHPDKEIRREICHGIELRGRTHPQDILPLLEKLQHDETSRVRNTLIHVLGQIAYKKGCLETVVGALKTWKNTELVKSALDEIVDVHHRYASFAFLSQQQAITYIDENYS
ncbi:HEAT repeat domain-containing protein [Ulvibacterium sp.]|uniref:HEAT repeat domain-containing protein n=1 Tax=Ulvibacterium sp. TaxID=2665914 RepID=UPI0026174BE6|nr:HEAT repeat domain-containing protein [Ulvibacterium sp.]